jgi:hypothetical protein
MSQDKKVVAETKLSK